MESTFFFNQINDLDLEWMGEHSYRITLSAGELFQLKSGIDAIGVLIEGGLVSEKNNHLIYLFKGDLVGENSLLDGEKKIYDYHATEASRVLMIQSQALHSRLKEDRIFASRLYRALAGQLASTMIRRVHSEGNDIDDAALAEIAKATAKFKKLCRLV